MIITISREFGSGGRELGKRLADELGIPCYDEQVIEMLMKNSELDGDYGAASSAREMQIAYSMTIGRRFSIPFAVMDQSVALTLTQRRIIEDLAYKGSCVIVGRCADVILEKMHPFRIFVYADKASKMERTLKRQSEKEKLTAAQIQRKMKQIDKTRAKKHELLSDIPWGRKECYDLCVNTSGKEIKTLVPAVTAYVKSWFQK